MAGTGCCSVQCHVEGTDELLHCHVQGFLSETVPCAVTGTNAAGFLRGFRIPGRAALAAMDPRGWVRLCARLCGPSCAEAVQLCRSFRWSLFASSVLTSTSTSHWEGTRRCSLSATRTAISLSVGLDNGRHRLWQDGQVGVQLEFVEALFGVESCMEECFLKPTAFVAAAVAAASPPGRIRGFLARLAPIVVLSRGSCAAASSSADPWPEMSARGLVKAPGMPGHGMKPGHRSCYSARGRPSLLRTAHEMKSVSILVSLSCFFAALKWPWSRGEPGFCTPAS